MSAQNVISLVELRNDGSTHHMSKNDPNKLISLLKKYLTPPDEVDSRNQCYIGSNLISCFSGLKILKNFKKKVHIKISKLKKDFKSEINPDPKDLHREPITTNQLKKVNHLKI